MTPSAGGPLRVLLVDDDEVDRLTVARALASHGPQIQIVECIAADHALALLAEVDCVLSDLHMPGHDGRWLLAAVLERGGPPVLMLTGTGDEEIAADLMRSGAADYLSKAQLRGDKLVLAIERAVEMDRVTRAHARVQAAHAESEERLRAALDAAGMGTFVFKPPVVIWDERACEIFGVPPHSVRTADDGYRNIHADDVDRVRSVMDRAMDPKLGGAFHIEFRIVRPSDGEVRWISAAGRPFFDEHQQLVRVAGTMQDLTERRKLEEQARTYDQLQQHWLGVVSHDLRGPLHAITLSVATLLQSSTLAPAAERAVKRIASAADRATRLTNDLLDFTRVRSGGRIPLEPRSCDLDTIVRVVVEEALATHPTRKIQIEMSGDTTGIWDAGRVEQALSNLLTNALTYSPPDSVVRVRATGASETASVEVTNQGEPIPPAVLRKLFEPFERGQTEEKRGLGLGLFIVRALVHAHEGQVHVSSSREHGTSFRIELPRRPRAVVAVAAS